LYSLLPANNNPGIEATLVNTVKDILSCPDRRLTAIYIIVVDRYRLLHRWVDNIGLMYSRRTLSTTLTQGSVML